MSFNSVKNNFIIHETFEYNLVGSYSYQVLAEFCFLTTECFDKYVFIDIDITGTQQLSNLYKPTFVANIESHSVFINKTLSIDLPDY